MPQPLWLRRHELINAVAFLHMAEDRRIAFAALAVAAVVPIVTLWASTKHDSNRLHAEQVQVDRAELREVLDDAATALNLILVNFNELLQLGPQDAVNGARRDKVVVANLARVARATCGRGPGDEEGA
jgi:hypothetical protein